MPKCLDCKAELNNSTEIIYHTCASHPPRKEESWVDNIFKKENNE